MNAVIGCSTTVVETQLSSAATKASRAERSNPVAELERQQQFWQQRLERDPSDFISRHKSAQLLMQLARVTGDHNRYVQAEAVLRPGVEFAPVYELLVDLAFALNAQHKFAEAMQVAQTAVGLDSSATVGWAALGDAQLELGQGAAAQVAYQKLLDADEGFFGLSRWANLLRAQGDEVGATAAFESAVIAGTLRGVDAAEVARAHIQLGEIQFLRGRFEQARLHYLDAVVLWPDGYLPLEHMAEIEAALGNYQASAALYDRVLAEGIHPDLQETYADVRAELGDADGAAELRRAAHAAYLASVQSGDLSYLSHLIDLTIERGDAPGRAIEWAARDAALRPTAQSKARLALAYAAGGDCSQAIATATDAMASELPPNISAKHQLGKALFRCREEDRGRPLLRAVLAHNPKHPEAEAIKQLLGVGP
jgi:tetratricopeptide (TPR) repeat protein